MKEDVIQSLRNDLYTIRFLSAHPDALLASKDTT